MLEIAILALGTVVAMYVAWNIIQFFLQAYRDGGPAKRKNERGR